MINFRKKNEKEEKIDKGLAVLTKNTNDLIMARDNTDKQLQEINQTSKNILVGLGSFGGSLITSLENRLNNFLEKLQSIIKPVDEDNIIRKTNYNIDLRMAEAKRKERFDNINNVIINSLLVKQNEKNGRLNMECLTNSDDYMIYGRIDDNYILEQNKEGIDKALFGYIKQFYPNIYFEKEENKEDMVEFYLGTKEQIKNQCIKFRNKLTNKEIKEEFVDFLINKITTGNMKEENLEILKEFLKTKCNNDINIFKEEMFEILKLKFYSDKQKSKGNRFKDTSSGKIYDSYAEFERKTGVSANELSRKFRVDDFITVEDETGEIYELERIYNA